MGRRKGDTNKKRTPAAIRYWRVRFGLERATNDLQRKRKELAKRETGVPADADFVARLTVRMEELEEMRRQDAEVELRDFAEARERSLRKLLARTDEARELRKARRKPTRK